MANKNETSIKKSCEPQIAGTVATCSTSAIKPPQNVQWSKSRLELAEDPGKSYAESPVAFSRESNGCEPRVHELNLECAEKHSSTAAMNTHRWIPPHVITKSQKILAVLASRLRREYQLPGNFDQEENESFTRRSRLSRSNGSDRRVKLKPNTYDLILLCNILGSLLGILSLSGGVYLCVACAPGHNGKILWTGRECQVEQKLGCPFGIIIGIFSIAISVWVIHSAWLKQTHQYC